MPTPRETHDWDQALAAVGNLALQVATYYASLVENGVPAAEAVMLSKHFSETCLRIVMGAGSRSE